MSCHQKQQSFHRYVLKLMLTKSHECVIDDYSILSRAKEFSYKTAEIVFPQ